jgi:hypothetical protein
LRRAFAVPGWECRGNLGTEHRAHLGWNARQEERQRAPDLNGEPWCGPLLVRQHPRALRHVRLLGIGRGHRAAEPRQARFDGGECRAVALEWQTEQ